MGIFLLCALASCESISALVKPALEEDGEIRAYLEPFPQEGAGLVLAIDGLSAVGAAGVRYPLTVKLGSAEGGKLRRQRLLGEADLPPGSYSGLEITLREAVTRDDNGEHRLTFGGPVVIPCPFRVERKRGYVISVLLDPGSLPKTGSAFTPVFSATIPAKPLPGVTGYVSNSGSNDISVIDKEEGRVIGVIPTPGSPAGMALDQKLLKAYVAVPSSGQIVVVDVVSSQLTNTLQMAMGDRPVELALTPDGKTILSVNSGSNSVSFIDSASLTETSRVATGPGPSSVTIDPTARRAYVTNNYGNTLTVIDIANRAVATTIATDPGPVRAQFNSLGTSLFVIQDMSLYLTVIDPLSLNVKRVKASMGLESIKVDTNTSLVYMGRKGDPAVGVYEPNSFVAMDYVKTGGWVSYMTIDGETNSLVMLCPSARELTASSLVGGRALWTIDVGDSPYWIDVMGER